MRWNGYQILKTIFTPPWRIRLREIQQIIEDTSQEFFPLPKSVSTSEKTVDSVNRRFELIKNITKDDKDKKTIQNDPILEIAYSEMDKHIVEAKRFFQEDLKDRIITSKTLYTKRLNHLIDRLDHEIPPNAFEISINDREPANIVEIINAAWFHKISWGEQIFKDDGPFNKDMCKKRDIINRLTLKSIEYADIETEYRNKMGKPAQYNID